MKIVTHFIILCSMFLLYSCIDEQVIVENKTKATGLLVINSEPDSAKIFFLGTDTKKVTSDSIGGLESGTYDVTLKLDGYRDTTFLVTILNDHKTTKNIVLEEKQVGSVHVTSDPTGAQIIFAGKNTSKRTPDSLVNIDPGVYSLALRLPGFRDTSMFVTVQIKEVAAMNVFLKDTLPDLEVTLEYTKIQFGQVLFSFEFNRDIKLNEILSRGPASGEITTTRFNENVEQGDQRILIFGSQGDGTWYFTLRGEKLQGDKRSFEIHQNIEVE